MRRTAKADKRANRPSLSSAQLEDQRKLLARYNSNDIFRVVRNLKARLKVSTGVDSLSKVVSSASGILTLPDFTRRMHLLDPQVFPDV